MSIISALNGNDILNGQHRVMDLDVVDQSPEHPIIGSCITCRIIECTDGELADITSVNPGPG